MKEALFYTRKGDEIKCNLCPRQCMIQPDETGECLVRKNIGGKLFAMNYGQFTSLALDPIEKKPLFHFYPGTQVISIGSTGCNLNCQFCQNWQISQQRWPGQEVTPQQVGDMALKYSKRENPCMGIAYTFSEPFVWYEFVLDTAVEVRKKGLKNILVTNGFHLEEPLENLLPYIDAVDIDLKAYSTEFYRKVCNGEFEGVKRSIAQIAAKCHMELTFLLIPSLNDSETEIEAMASWIAEIDKNIPVHFLRYFPNYRLQNQATTLDELVRARKIAQKYLPYCYVGNALEFQHNHTVCPQCGRDVIKRSSYGISENNLSNGNCKYCGFLVPIIQ